MSGAPAPDLPSKVLTLHDALASAGIPHQFGGALALAYCVGEPRATGDIDVNVTVPPARAADVLAALPDCEGPADVLERIERDGQARLWWGTTPVDVFFGYHDFHDYLAETADTVPFAHGEIPVLAGEGLVVCKAMFNRTKDWQDIEAIADAGATDLERARAWLDRLLGTDDDRTAKLDAIISHSSDASARDDVAVGDLRTDRVSRLLGRPPGAPS